MYEFSLIYSESAAILIRSVCGSLNYTSSARHGSIYDICSIMNICIVFKECLHCNNRKLSRKELKLARSCKLSFGYSFTANSLNKVPARSKENSLNKVHARSKEKEKNKVKLAIETHKKMDRHLLINELCFRKSKKKIKLKSTKPMLPKR